MERFNNNMKLKKVFIKPNASFAGLLTDWAQNNELEIEPLPLEEGFDENVEGLVILNQNLDIEKDLQEIRNIFDKTLKPVQRIDINGTLMVGVSNFSLWLERNGCSNILILGADSLKDNPNLSRYLDAMNLK
jgi:hypothetical protein